MKPLLRFSPLGKRVYVLTRYAVKGNAVVASRQLDVTEDFAALLWDRDVRRAFPRPSSARHAGRGVCGHGPTCTRERCRDYPQSLRAPEELCCAADGWEGVTHAKNCTRARPSDRLEACPSCGYEIYPGVPCQCGA